MATPTPAAVAVEPGTGTALLLDALTRPFDPVRAAAALVGIPVRVARQLVGGALATSDEAEHLLDSMHQIVRSLAIATTDRPERCYGELRGPVLWSETMSARSASAGDPGLFVCSTTTKAYDTDENRVLKAALAAINRAGRDATAGMDAHADELLRRARHNETRARHLLEHQALSGVPVTRVGARTLQRTRSGSRRNTYAPAIAVLQRATAPITVAHLQGHVTDAVSADHDLLAAGLGLLAAIDPRGRGPALRTSDGGLVAGPLHYDALGGVTVDGGSVRTLDDLVSAVRANAARTPERRRPRRETSASPDGPSPTPPSSSPS